MWARLSCICNTSRPTAPMMGNEYHYQHVYLWHSWNKNACLADAPTGLTRPPRVEQFVCIFVWAVALHWTLRISLDTVCLSCKSQDSWSCWSVVFIVWLFGYCRSAIVATWLNQFPATIHEGGKVGVNVTGLRVKLLFHACIQVRPVSELMAVHLVARASQAKCRNVRRLHRLLKPWGLATQWRIFRCMHAT